MLVAKGDESTRNGDQLLRMSFGKASSGGSNNAIPTAVTETHHLCSKGLVFGFNPIAALALRNRGFVRVDIAFGAALVVVRHAGRGMWRGIVFGSIVVVVMTVAITIIMCVMVNVRTIMIVCGARRIDVSRRRGVV